MPLQQPRHTALVCNPLQLNKQPAQVAQFISGVLAEQGLQHTIFATNWPQQWDDFSEVWIIGGDGTLNYFINKYPQLTLPLALFEAGSGNDFFWMLYGKPTLNQQVQTVLSATPQPVDAGLCNGRLFLNGIGIGFDGAIVKDLVGKRKMAGKASYLLSVLKHIFNYREQQFTVQSGLMQTEHTALMISIANGRRYGGGFYVAPQALVNDGQLDVCIIDKIDAPRRIKYLPVIEKGQHLELPFVNCRKGEAVNITCNTIIPAHADGEYFESNAFEIRCLPGRFSFLLPHSGPVNK